jgi:hypothetical protein
VAEAWAPPAKATACVWPAACKAKCTVSLEVSMASQVSGKGQWVKEIDTFSDIRKV